MFIGAGAVAARWYIGNNDKKEIKYFILSGIFTALALTAWFLVPALTPLLSIVLVPLIPYFLYNTYRLIKGFYNQYRNKQNKIQNENDSAIKALVIANPEKAILTTSCNKQIESLIKNIPEHVKAYLKGLAIQNPQRALELANTVKKIDLIFKNLSKSINDKFYESLMNLILVDHQKAYSVAEWTRKIDNDFNGVRQSTRDKFFDSIIQLAYIGRDDALVLAIVVKEIDDIVSGITNKELLDYFDQFFTFTEVQNPPKRSELIEFARKCKEINESSPNSIQKFLATQIKSRPEGLLTIKPTDVIHYLKIESSCARETSSTAESWVSRVSDDAHHSIQGGVIRN
jgi:hypothetical protein